MITSFDMITYNSNDNLDEELEAELESTRSLLDPARGNGALNLELHDFTQGNVGRLTEDDLFILMAEPDFYPDFC